MHIIIHSLIKNNSFAEMIFNAVKISFETIGGLGW